MVKDEQEREVRRPSNTKRLVRSTSTPTDDLLPTL
jgi:hypothetical protein